MATAKIRHEFEQRPALAVLRVITLSIGYGLVVGWAITSLIPMVWLFITAMIPLDFVITFPPAINNVGFDNFVDLFNSKQAPILRWMLNTTFVAVLVTAFKIFFDTLAGYAFAKRRFPGRELIFWSILATLMIPGQVRLVPMFMLLRNIGLQDSLWGVIVPAMSGAGGIFLMRQFLKTLPRDIEDAARIDGASEFGIFVRIILPLAKPGMAVLGISTFMFEWKNLLWPLIVLRTPAKYMLEVGLASLQQEFLTDYGVQMAGAAFSAIPMIIVFFFFQHYLMEGWTIGGSLKG